MWESASAAERVTDVRLDVTPDPELDPEAAERLLRRLRTELAALDVESARFTPGAAPPEGAKGSDAVTLGAIVVALSASGGVFTSLIGAVQDWLGRSSARHRISVTVDGDTIELESATDAERRALVEAFVRRHSGEGR
ncbi:MULTISPECIES: hypothetical protein [unclassified Streptomyces]|uniref:effector-associated constant component EACC1 n=1 Tax=unclassified Streptomyces TaxID=2593676 RepID=UPI000DD8AD8C|nr:MULTISPECIES: hypothetical protein [unclassified Streptomyces]QZZ31642.1 hypothetical protein A7X85_40370 [Streptomyces sp. ST1015]